MLVPRCSEAVRRWQLEANPACVCVCMCVCVCVCVCVFCTTSFGGCLAEQETIFVDSQISDLGNPIGGCYEQASVTTSDGFPFYSLGGGASVGQAWISVGGEVRVVVVLVCRAVFARITIRNADRIIQPLHTSELLTHDLFKFVDVRVPPSRTYRPVTHTGPHRVKLVGCRPSFFIPAVGAGELGDRHHPGGGRSHRRRDRHKVGVHLAGFCGGGVVGPHRRAARRRLGMQV